jgi:hypothetical protein
MCAFKAGPCTDECMPKTKPVRLSSQEKAEMLDSPNSSSFLKVSLESMRSEDAAVRMLALRDFNNTYGPLAFSGVGGQRAVNAATFLLEGGFLDPIADGLKAAAGGQWMVCPGPSHPLYAVRCKRHGMAVSLSLKQAILLLYALGSVALDARLVSFILRKRPDIPGTLEEMYNAAGGHPVADRVEIRAEIGRTHHKPAPPPGSKNVPGLCKTFRLRVWSLLGASSVPNLHVPLWRWFCTDLVPERLATKRCRFGTRDGQQFEHQNGTD